MTNPDAFALRTLRAIQETARQAEQQTELKEFNRRVTELVLLVGILGDHQLQAQPKQEDTPARPNYITLVQ